MTPAVALALLLLPAVGPPPPATLPAKVEAVLKRPEYQGARWGLLVVDAATGKSVYEHNAEQLFAPASVTKLYSCAAALAVLGADHRFETPVYSRGKLAGGRLTGDLILVGQGDLAFGGRTGPNSKMAFAADDHIYSTAPKLTTGLTDTDPLAGLKDLARQVKASGIKQVTGDVLIDDRLFDLERGSGSGPGILTPLLVNDNIIDVIVTPAAKGGQPATFKLRPETDFVQIDVRVDTVARGERTNITTRRVGPQRYVVRGQIAVGVKPQVRICLVDNPAMFARALFIEALRREGVEVGASVLRFPTADLPEEDSYPRLKRVALHKSLPLSEALKVTLKVSHNLYASTLPLLLAARSGQRSLAEGMRLQGKALKGLGVDIDRVSLDSGAGGGNGDKVSPRATVQLLQALRKRPDWGKYYDALPILGVDGTLATAVSKNSPARGKARGKTGTYTDSNLLLGKGHLRSKTLAGVMTSAKGRELTFAIFVNDVALPRGVTPAREGRVIGRLCEIIHQYAP